MATTKVFNKQDIEDIIKRGFVPQSYIRAYYHHLFESEDRIVQSQKLACKVIIKSGISKDSDTYKMAFDTLSRMTKKTSPKPKPQKEK
jgi:hypothetical protein